MVGNCGGMHALLVVGTTIRVPYPAGRVGACVLCVRSRLIPSSYNISTINTAVFSSILARPNDTIGYPVLDE